jgi:NitT/TauT family transport system substrate-binding protein
VQRFVDASIDRLVQLSLRRQQAANALIKKLNPEMTDELLAYSVAKMKEYGIVDSGDTLKLGIGAMTDARMASFFDKMVRPAWSSRRHRFPQGLHAAFVNKGVGLDLRPKN